MSPEFGAEDRLIIVLGELDQTARTLRDLCERSDTSSNEVEWRERLGDQHRKLLIAIERVLGRAQFRAQALGTCLGATPPFSVCAP
jgi:hypothetical protein